jgi:hypothetical protein
MIIKNRFTGEKIMEIENLRGANLYGDNLSSANLSGTNLCDANLSSADLSGADLCSANLRRANLCHANLSGVNLSGANLSGADLSGVNLSGANLSGANLCRANLYDANLFSADLCRANLSGVNLRGAKNIPELTLARLSICPEGDIIGYKKCRDDIIVKLLIPSDAKRSNGTGRKCRAEYVKTLEIYGDSAFAVSEFDWNIIYFVGEITRADFFDENRFNECSHGIHFFLTRTEAEKYN